MLQCSCGKLPEGGALHAPREVLVQQFAWMRRQGEIVVRRDAELLRFGPELRERFGLTSKARKPGPLAPGLGGCQRRDGVSSGRRLKKAACTHRSIVPYVVERRFYEQGQVLQSFSMCKQMNRGVCCKSTGVVIGVTAFVGVGQHCLGLQVADDVCEGACERCEVVAGCLVRNLCREGENEGSVEPCILKSCDEFVLSCCTVGGKVSKAVVFRIIAALWSAVRHGNQVRAGHAFETGSCRDDFIVRMRENEEDARQRKVAARGCGKAINELLLLWSGVVLFWLRFRKHLHGMHRQECGKL